jgi:hypothetical protein
MNKINSCKSHFNAPDTVMSTQARENSHEKKRHSPWYTLLMNQWILNQWPPLMSLPKILSLKNPKWSNVSNTSQKMGRKEKMGM